MATVFGASGVICWRTYSDEWYRVDLDSLPEEGEVLSPIARLEHENSVNWTTIGEDIFCTGGVLENEYTGSKTLYKLDTTTKPLEWALISSDRKFPHYQPFVFAIDRKIYALGGDIFPEGFPTDWTHGGEVYDLDTQTWNAVASTWKDFAQFSGAPAARVDKHTVVFYSFRFSSLLFYNAAKDELFAEHHPEFALFGDIGVPRGFLMHVARNMRAVVYDSTLYWLNADLHLYGYDFVKRRWLRSNNSLDGAFPSVPPDQYPWSSLPVLLNLDNNGTFLVIHSYSRDNRPKSRCSRDNRLIFPESRILGIASLMVCKEDVSLTVSVKFIRTLEVDPSCILYDGKLT